MIIKLDGFSTKTAQDFVDGLDAFAAFVKKNKHIAIATNDATAGEESTGADSTDTLKTFVVVFSGVRNKALEKVIEKNGGKVTTSVSKTTTHLVVADADASSGKATKAKANNIPIMTLKDFESLLASSLA